MTFQLTQKANQARSKINIDPIFVMKVDGIDEYFSIVKAQRVIRIGDEGLEIGDDWVIGGVYDDENSLDYIAKEFTSTQIAQQIEPDKGSVSSVTQMQVRIIDKNRFASQLISPGVKVPEILGRRVWCYMGFKGTAYPDDYFRVFQGSIVEVDSGAGWVEIVISHPDEKKRQKLFKKFETTLAGGTVERNFGTGDVDITNNWIEISGGHGVAEDGLELIFDVTSSGGSDRLPKPLKENKKYYAIVVNSDRLRVAANYDNAISGVYIDLKDVGVGSFHFVNSQLNTDSTTVLLSDVSGLFAPVPGKLRSFVRIDDEFIEWTSLSGNNLVGAVRGALSVYDAKAVAAPHSANASVSSFYILEGNCIELYLNLLLSGSGYGIQNVPVQHVQEVEGGTVSNALYYRGIDLEKDYGLRAGDFVSNSGATNGANNFTGRTIVSITVQDDGSYLVVNGAALVSETDSPAVSEFKSQYDVLSDGLGLTPDEVDIDQAEFLRETFLASPSYRFYISDSIDGKDFLGKQLMIPIACYTLPRATRASMQIHNQPLPFAEIITLSKDNIYNPDKVVLKRSFDKNFYNTIVYKFDQDLYETSKFRSAVVITDEDSRSDMQKRQDLVIEAQGVRSDIAGGALATAVIQRLLNRYKRGAEYFDEINVMFKDGILLEPGDSVLMDFDGLNVTNTLDGTRKRGLKFYEVRNKGISLNGGVTVSVVDTGFDGSDRIALFSPASYVIGGTASAVTIKPSFSMPYGDNEYKKWEPFIGATIQVRSLDYTTRLAVRTLIGVSGNTLLLNTPLPFTPVNGDVVEFADYDDQILPKVKQVYAFRSDDDNDFADGGEAYKYF